MALPLQKVILNGSSRHRLSKGFILVTAAGTAIDAALGERIVLTANAALKQTEDLGDFQVEPHHSGPATVGLVTPFSPVYGRKQRDTLFARLTRAIAFLSQAAHQVRCRLVPAGVNPYQGDQDSAPSILCADIHEIEVFDEGEIERIYNLFRQFLAELLAISTHSSIYGGSIQKDFSVRMRVNPTSFLPRYLSQFSAERLSKLERMMRKDYGLTDLRQMDVNPVSGHTMKQSGMEASLFDKRPPAVELRFIDAQCSLAFIRAQILLFQAIAMYGRSLARQGKRLPFMRDEVIDENKALAIQGGAGAMLKPDPKFKKDAGGRGFWFHDQGIAERASTALIQVIEGLLLPALQDLGCGFDELAPVLLGAELRARGKRCLTTYAEYQQYLYYTHKQQFASSLVQQTEQMLASPTHDFLVAYNRHTYPQLTTEIETEWTQKLTPRSRAVGYVKSFNQHRRQGIIQLETGGELSVEATDLEGVESLEPGERTSFEVLERRGRPLAVRVRVEEQPRQQGTVIHFNSEKGFGHIADEAGNKLFVRASDVTGNATLRGGMEVTFVTVPSDRGPRAAKVQVNPRPKVQEESHPRYHGTVKWFNAEKRFGYISVPGSNDIFVHESDVEGRTPLHQGQKVSFEIGHSPKGPKAIRVIAESSEAEQ